MNVLSPLNTLFETDTGETIGLPPELAGLYGRLRLPVPAGRPYLASNFVATLDGVGGGQISGFNPHDQLVMGLLRAASDVVIAGASAVRAGPGHIWTAEFIFPPLAGSFRRLRESLGRPEHPLNVIVTAQGSLDLSLPLFQTGTVPVLVLTTEAGAQRLSGPALPPSTRIQVLPGEGLIGAPAILAAVLGAIGPAQPAERILLEGGPRLLGAFLAADLLDELFLTVAPQIAGRSHLSERPALVAGVRFAPEDPRWARLMGVKQAGGHLFLRYSFAPAP
jgi:riboflavin biosynthesis pyrimidine reductase